MTTELDELTYVADDKEESFIDDVYDPIYDGLAESKKNHELSSQIDKFLLKIKPVSEPEDDIFGELED